MPNILLVDDNPEILAVNKTYLQGRGFDIAAVDTGVKAIVSLNANKFDCVVLDVMLPDIDGFTMCKAVRTLTGAPVIFLTCLDSEEEKIKGLALGADDYMTKPYSLKELGARIDVALRREQKEVRRVGELVIDKDNKMIQTPYKNVFLSQKEFELFTLLFEDRGKRFSKEEILKALWPSGADIGTVAVHILKLRRKLDFAKGIIGEIKNDYKHGYYIAKPGMDWAG